MPQVRDITDAEWQGLAGADSGPNGERPQVAYLTVVFADGRRAPAELIADNDGVAVIFYPERDEDWAVAKGMDYAALMSAWERGAPLSSWHYSFPVSGDYATFVAYARCLTDALALTDLRALGGEFIPT
jgi:hypothetical protein